MKISAISPLIGLIHLYQYLVSPYLGNRCRFEPSCSEYAVDALKRHGAWRGSTLGVAAGIALPSLASGRIRSRSLEF